MKYLNFEGLQYFYSKLSSSLASQYVSQGNLKTINGQSLIGTGDITIEGGASGDYLPLSGGTLTGSLYMTGGTQLQLIGIGGTLSFKDVENNTLASIYTFNDHSPVNDKSYGIIYCKTDDNSSSSTLSPGSLSLYGDKDIFIGNGDIKIDNVSIVGYSKSESDSRYLNVSGGTMTGDIEYMSPNSSVLCSIGTQGDVAHNNATGWITCDNIGSGFRTIIQGNGLRAYAQNSSDTAQPYQIEYFYDNIYIYFHQDSSTTRKYKFNIQKLIDDGYLIQE